IVLTAYADMPSIIPAINRAHVYNYLKKPWMPEEVLDAVARASEHVYQTRAIRRLVDLLAKRSDELAATVHELRAAQDQMLRLDRLGTMGRLASGVTHDLKNAIMSFMFLESEVLARALPSDLLETVRVG